MKHKIPPGPYVICAMIGDGVEINHWHELEEGVQIPFLYETLDDVIAAMKEDLDTTLYAVKKGHMPFDRLEDLDVGFIARIVKGPKGKVTVKYLGGTRLHEFPAKHFKNTILYVPKNKTTKKDKKCVGSEETSDSTEQE